MIRYVDVYGNSDDVDDDHGRDRLGTGSDGQVVRM